MPCFRGELCNQEIVWDSFRLLDSVKRPGAFYLLTCKCGCADDAGINEGVLVSHPDSHTVIWELDIAGYREVIDDSLTDVVSGFIRLVFHREEYEADVRAIMKELQRLGTTSFAAYPETEEFGVKELHRLHDFNFPERTTITVEELEPQVDGRDLDQLLGLDLTAAWESEPLWPTGTLVEFGFFPQHDGHELMRFNGQCSATCWPGWYFTRWQELEAFNNWLSFVQRACWIFQGKQIPCAIKTNEFVLLRETDRVLFHEAGRRLAEIMQSCCNEGNTAPAVTVLYTETDVRCAEKVTSQVHEGTHEAK
ncbi:MAG: hypothetical protein ACOYL3_12240 [Desulfuromonadaceae bacterium]